MRVGTDEMILRGLRRAAFVPLAVLLVLAGSADAATLKVQVFQKDTWQGGQGQWISGATVTVTGGVNLTQTTNAAGQVSFDLEPSAPGKTYLIKASKSGCSAVDDAPQHFSQRQYKMPTYNATVNLALDCGAPAVKHKLKIQVFEYGTWSGGQGVWIQGASVRVSGESVNATGTTNSQGVYGVAVPVSSPGQTYKLSTARRGCERVDDLTLGVSQKSHVMPAYDSVVNLSLKCGLAKR